MEGIWEGTVYPNEIKKSNLFSIIPDYTFVSL